MSTREMLPYAAFASHAWKEDDGRDNHALVVATVAALRSAPHNLKIWLDAEEIGVGNVTGQVSRGIESSEIALIFLSQRYIDGVDHRNWAPGKEWDNCEREYLEILKTKRYLRVVPIILDEKLRDQLNWGKKAQNDLADLIYYDASMLFAMRDEVVRGEFAIAAEHKRAFAAKVAELATAIEQTRAGEAKLKRYALRRVLHTEKTLQRPDAMAGAKLHDLNPVQRDWIFKEIKEWYEQRNWTRALMLGDAGMGKSVLAAMLTLHGGTVLANVPRRVSLRTLITRFSRRGSAQANGFTVGAVHFFSYADQNTSDVRALIYSIANQLCSAVPGLQAQLFAGPDAGALAKINDIAALFRRVIAEPCRAVAAPPDGRVVVIFDALDECERTARAQVLGILQTDFLRCCPNWLGFLATSRKEDYIPLVLRNFNPTLLDAEQHNNEDDLRLYFDCKLQVFGLAGSELKQATDLLTARSGGLFLYARFAYDGLNRLQRANNVTLAAIEDEANFPTGMSAVYAQYFECFKTTALGGSDTLYNRVIGSLVVARGPLPMALLELGDLDLEDFAEAARNLLVVGDDASLRFVHKSMADWVSGSDRIKPRHDLVVKPAVGHKQLADLCFKKQAHPFALRHALHHLCHAGRVADAAALLLDVSWLLLALQDDDVDPVDLMLDADRFLDRPHEPAGDVLRVLEKGANALRHDPREIASQLYGRLEKPHPALDSVNSSFTGRWLRPAKPSLEPARSPLRKTLVGHSNAVNSVAVSADLDMIVTGAFDKTVKVWKPSTGQLLRVLGGHSGEVFSVAVSAELDMIVSGSDDTTVKVWKASTGELLGTLEGHSAAVKGGALSAELDMIVSGSDNGTVKVWKASTCELLRTLEGHLLSVNSVVVSAELVMIVSGSNDKTVKVWKASTGQLLRTLEGHTDVVNSVAVSAELGIIVSGSRDIKVWKSGTGRLLRTLKGHTDVVNSVAVSAELNMIVSGSRDKNVKVWKASRSKLLRTLQGHYASVCSVAVSAELDMIVTGSRAFSDSGNTLKVWKASTDWQSRTFEGYHLAIQSVAVSAELDMIVSGSNDMTVKLWKASTGQLLRTLAGHYRQIYSVAVSADLGMVASGSLDQTVKVWKASTGQLLRSLEGHTDAVYSVAVSAELNMIVSGSGGGTVKLWKASTGQLLRTLVGLSGVVWSVAVSGELDMIVSGSQDKTVKVWNASTGQLLRTLVGHLDLVISVVVSTDMIKSRDAADKTVFWDVLTFAPIQPSESRDSPRFDDAVAVQAGCHVSISRTDCAGFSTDATVWSTAREGSIVAVGDAAGIVHVLNLT